MALDEVHYLGHANAIGQVLRYVAEDQGAWVAILTFCSAALRYWPAPVLETNGVPIQAANCLYQVDDSAYAGSQPLYRIIMNASKLAELTQINRNSPSPPYSTSDQTRSHSRFNATFISIDGTSTELRYLTGVRNRGNGSRSRSPQSYNLTFNNDHLWKRQTSLNLNTQTTHAQLAGSALYQVAGVPMADSRAVQVRVNGANLAPSSAPSYGFYACNEVANSEFADRHFPFDSSGNIYRGNRLVAPGADLHYEGTNAAPYRNNYAKHTNVSEDDWSDLIQLTDILSNTPDPEYPDRVRAVVNVEQWMRYFAVETLVANKETNLANGNNGDGEGDDYYLDRGVDDPRFQVIPYDLDTIMNQGDTRGATNDSLWRMTANPTLNRFMKRPEFAPLYYRELKHQLDYAFEPSRLNTLMDQVLGGLVPAGTIQSVKDFQAARGQFVLSQIPLSITVTSSLPVVSGYPQTTTAAVSLTGRANAMVTRSVRVNGAPAVWSAWEATWTATNVILLPGINRVLVQAFDTNAVEIDRGCIDVWYDTGSTTDVAGTLGANTTWWAASGPYRMTASLTVPNGVTLTIEAGATVDLASGVNLVVAHGGRLLAEGTETRPIRLASPPGTGTRWGGITVNGATGSPETRLAHVHLEGNNSTAIHSAGGTGFLDHLTFGTTDEQCVSLDGSSFVVQDCVFPATTASFEPVHGSGGIKSGGRGLFLRNFFGPITGYNDTIDFTGGQRPGPIVQFINNVFMGSGDDFLDLDNTDAWVEGNLFLHAHKNGSPDTSSAISGGNDTGQPSDVTIIGNLIYDCDHAVNAKQDNFYTLINNTILRQTHQGGLDAEGAVVCLADNGMSEGKGILLEGNIIHDAEQLTRDLVAATVTFTNNLMPLAWSGPGGDNSTNNPQLVYVPHLSETFFTNWAQAQVMRDWFSLKPGSPARGSGPEGRDQGGVIPLGASLSGEPASTTHRTDATLVVGVNRTGSGITLTGWPDGSGYTHYRWRLDTNAWSAETPIATPIPLTALAPGPHRVEATGRRDSGFYQDDPVYGLDAVITPSRTWTVDPSRSRLLINEVLAKNVAAVAHGATFPDLIELYNDSASTIDLSDMSLTDSASSPRKFVFPAGTLLESGKYLVLYADNESGDGIHLRFTLKQGGDDLYLFDKPANGAGLLDSVGFGLQLPDLSIGRLSEGRWGLTQPTFGGANRAAPTGDPAVLKINEWLAAVRLPGSDSFIELYNQDPLPTPIGGLHLSDNPMAAPEMHLIAPLSFVPGGGFAAFLADGNTNQGADHLNFKLAAEQGVIGLSDADLNLLDVVFYGPQRTDIAQGRSPSGSETLKFFAQPTPGAGNPGFQTGYTVTTVSTPLVVMTNAWRYNPQGLPLGSGWSATNYDDTIADWPTGRGAFYHGNPVSFSVPINTTLNYTTPIQSTFYFRTHFGFSDTNVAAGFSLAMANLIDDGAVFYLNGQEVYRQNMPDGAVSYSTPASNRVDVAGLLGPISIPATRLVEGDNVLAVEVHQINSSSTDLTFAMSLDAVVSITNVTGLAMPVVLNEVRAYHASVSNPDGSVSDWVELYNPATNAVDMSGLSLSDETAAPRKFAFAPGTIVPGNGYLVIRFDPDHPVSATNAGFNLSAGGGGVFLFDTLANHEALLDAVTFGPQALDFTVGRVPDGGGAWTLSLPTPAAENIAAVLGDPASLKINEWMARPATGDDWFELYNPNSQPVGLSGLALTDDLLDRDKNPLPPLSFIGYGDKGFLKFIADGSTGTGADHVRFKLGEAAASIGLFTSDGRQVEAIHYGPQATNVSQGRFPDGSGSVTSFPGSASPGESNFLPLPNVVVNEVLSHTDPPWEDAIEFYNPSGAEVDLSGWYLSNSGNDLRKVQLPAGTVVPTGGYRVLYEAQFGTGTAPGVATPFTLNSAQGDLAVLSQTNGAGGLSGYRARTQFGAAANGISFGRHLTSVGVDFVAMSRRTFGVDNPASVEAFRQGQGAANTGPLVGPAVINEIMYHPAEIDTNDNTIDEFIEIQSVTNALVPFYDPAATTNTWRLRGAVSYTFPTNVTLPAGGFFLLVGFDPSADVTALSAFRTRYGVSPVVPVLGPYSGKLSNTGESLQLFKPDPPQMAPHPDAGYVPYVLVDQVNYGSAAPWPTSANGGGTSLQRSTAGAYGNEPLNWRAAIPTAGRANDAQDPDSNGDGLPDGWQTNYFGSITAPQAAPGADPDADGLTNLEEFEAAGLARCYRVVTPSQP